MKQKKIMIVRFYSGYGGIEHQIETIIKGLNEKEWKTYIYTDVKSPFSEQCEVCGAKVIIQPYDNILKMALKIKKVCKEENISIVQSMLTT